VSPDRRLEPEAGERASEQEAPEPQSAHADPALLSLLAMQQTAGNAAVARMLAQQRGGEAPVTAAPRQQVQRGLWDDITGAVSSAASAVGGAVSDAASAVGGAVTSAASAVGGAVSDAAGWVADVATSAWDGLTDAAKAAWEGISAAGAFVGKWGMNVLGTVGDWVYDLVTEAPERIWRLLTHVGSGIVGTLGWMWDGLKAGAGHAWDGLVGVFSWLGDGAMGMFNWVWKGIERGEAWARRVLSGDWNALREGLSGLGDWIGQGFKGLINWGWDGLTAAGIWIAEGAKGVGRWVLDGFLSGAAWTGRFIAKLLDLAGAGELIDLLGEVLKMNTRELSGGEITEADKVFAGTIDYGQVRVDEHSLISAISAKFSGGGGMGVTLFHTINFNKVITPTAGSQDMGWLIHEMTHVWQYEHVGSQYLGEAIHAQATVGYKYGTSTNWRDNGNGTFLANQRTAGATFASFNREQQGDITEHYYLRRTNGLDTTDWQPYIDDVQAGVG
jgi:hypothetical protein